MSHKPALYSMFLVVQNLVSVQREIVQKVELADARRRAGFAPANATKEEG